VILLQPTLWVLNKKKTQEQIPLHPYFYGIAWIFVGEMAFGWFALALALTHGIDLMKLQFKTTKQNARGLCSIKFAFNIHCHNCWTL
jgi:hypothetical protein